jgi:DoxX-like family
LQNKNKIMIQKTTKIIKWIITYSLTALFIMSAIMKIIKNEGAVQQATSIGINASTNQILGVIELISAILFVIPRTGVLGSLLLISYMGGAIATHLEHGQSVVMVIVIQTLIWVSAGIRFNELSNRLFSKN